MPSRPMTISLPVHLLGMMQQHSNIIQEYIQGVLTLRPLSMQIYTYLA